MRAASRHRRRLGQYVTALTLAAAAGLCSEADMQHTRLFGRVTTSAGEPAIGAFVHVSPWLAKQGTGGTSEIVCLDADGSRIQVGQSVESPGSSTMTDARGVFTFSELDGARLRALGELEIWAECGSDVSARERIPLGELPVEGAVLQLGPGLKFSVLVQDLDGRPVVGAGVTVLAVSPGTSESGGRPQVCSLTGRTDRFGDADLPRLSERGDWEVTIKVSSEGMCESVVGPRPLRELHRNGKVTVALKRGLVVRGQVVRADGHPAAGATVVALIRGEPSSLEAKCDEGGAFVLSGFPVGGAVGAWEVCVRPSGSREVAWARSEALSGADEGDIAVGVLTLR